MAVQNVTYDHVVKKAREYYEKGKLTAQHPNWNLRECVYREGDYRCAIGAGLRLPKNEEITGTVDMLPCELYKISDEDMPKLMKLQKYHDVWASYGNHDNENIEKRKRSRSKQNFVRMLYREKKS